MKRITLACCLLLANAIYSQSVGIGTSSPNASSVLDLGPSAKPLIMPRLTNTQMNAVTNDAQGMMIYNATQHQLYGYMRTGTVTINNSSIAVNKWLPISTGPQMIAWGVVDSFGTELNGSGNYSVVWDASNNWYTLSTTSHPFYKDSMMLLVTPIGNGSWDQAVAIGELVESSTRRATIKFTDVSRIASGWTSTDSRRRSWFYFALYNLRKDPYNLEN